MRLVVTGGGTGGHIYPAIAIAQACAQDAELAPLRTVFVGCADGLEAKIVPHYGLRTAWVRAAPFERRFSVRSVRDVAATVGANALGFLQALRVLNRAKPDVLVATGGYVAFPVVTALRCTRALRLSRARIALLEANVAAGLTNRLLAPFCDEIWYAQPPSRALRPGERVTGMPVRASLRAPLEPDTARRELGLQEAATTIVVMGGSQGASSLNEAVAGLIEDGLPDGWQVLVVAGSRDHATLAKRLAGHARAFVRDYLADPRTAYAAADIVVARSGASTLAELAATRTPALLVPYPYATDDHQRRNAQTFAATGAAVVLADADLTAARLRAELKVALEPERFARLRAAACSAGDVDAAAAIAARVKALGAAARNGSVP